MKISWLNIQSAFNQNFSMHKNKTLTEMHKNSGFIEQSIKSNIYKHWYRKSDRSQTVVTTDIINEWNEFAIKAISEPSSRWDIRKLQVHRSGANAFIEKKRPSFDIRRQDYLHLS